MDKDLRYVKYDQCKEKEYAIHSREKKNWEKKGKEDEIQSWHSGYT